MSESEPRLYIDAQGDGPALLCLHGFGGSARNFRPQLRALRSKYRVVTFDARGHARSEAPPSTAAYHLEDFVRDVGRVLDETETKRAALMGLSMGAAVALSFAADNPARVRGLVLASIPPGGPAEAWASPFADVIDAEGLETAGERFVWGGGRFDAGAAALIRKGFLEHAPHALAATLRHVLGHLPDPAIAAERIAALEIPTLLVAGAEDAPSLAASRALAQRIPSVELEVVQGAGHVVNLQAPRQFNALAEEFLAKLKG